MEHAVKVQKSNQMDMIHSSLWKSIFLFALPVALSNILEQLFNSVDMAVVGQFAGDNALAAVSANASVTALFINMISGMAVGPNVVIAKLVGQGRKEEVQDAVHTVIAFALFCGGFLFLIGEIVASLILTGISTPVNILGLAETYLRIYFIGIPFLVLYNFGSAILRSVGDTKRPLYCLIFSGVLNALLNLLLVIVFHLGVAGVAIATSVSNMVSAAIVLSLLLRETDMIRVSLRKVRIHKEHMIKILKVGTPAALQSAVFSISNVCIQSGINSFGEHAISGSTVGLTFEYFTYYIINAFNQAAVTFSSQNYGAREIRRCKKICWICMAEGMLLTMILSGIFTVWGKVFAGLYTTNTIVMAYALIRMHHVMMIEFLTGSYEISGSVLRGLGHSLLPAIITLLGSVCFRIFWLFMIFPMRRTFDMLVTVYPVSWIFTGGMMLLAYFIVTRKVFASES